MDSNVVISQPNHGTRTVCVNEDNSKCGNCYFYGCPCLNCENTYQCINTMTYEEFRETDCGHTNPESYEQFLKEYGEQPS